VDEQPFDAGVLERFDPPEDAWGDRDETVAGDVVEDATVVVDAGGAMVELVLGASFLCE
jgi:hypothetical protein